MRAEPARLGPGGGSTQIVALVRDLAGNPLSGASVAFSASAGTMSTGVAQTDANGEARSTLTTGRETTVTATVGAKSGETTVTVDGALGLSVIVVARPAGRGPHRRRSLSTSPSRPAAISCRSCKSISGTASRGRSRSPRPGADHGRAHLRRRRHVHGLGDGDRYGQQHPDAATGDRRGAGAPDRRQSRGVRRDTRHGADRRVYRHGDCRHRRRRFSAYEWTLGDGSTQSTTTQHDFTQLRLGGTEAREGEGDRIGRFGRLAQLVVTVS